MTNQDPGLTFTTPSSHRAPVRIAFCITDLDAGGAEKGLVQLVLGLDRSQWEPTVFCLGPEAELAPVLRKEGVTVECYGARSGRDLGVFRWLTIRLRKLQPRLLQGFLFHGNFVGRVAGRWAGVPVIVAGHRVAEREKRWHLKLESWTRRWVDHHVCVSRGVAHHLQQELGLSDTQITVIPNGVTISRREEASPVNLQSEFGFPANCRVVLAVGRLHPQKNFPFLLRAFHRVSAEMPEARLLIVGEGPERTALAALISELKLDNVVCMPGRRTDVLDLMRQSAVLAVSSRWEGMPNVVLEAMAAGLPVVSTVVEGIDELIPDSSHGRVVNQNDMERFAGAILDILQHPEAAQELAAASQHLVESKFTRPKMVFSYSDLYRRLID